MPCQFFEVVCHHKGQTALGQLRDDTETAKLRGDHDHDVRE